MLKDRMEREDNIMELENTIDMMMSTDYKERFKAEYYQVKIRAEKLAAMLKKWDSGDLDFNPTCPRELYNDQISAMNQYLEVLEARAELEGVSL